MADIAENLEVAEFPRAKSPQKSDTEPPAPVPDTPPAALAPLPGLAPERDLELVDLPTEFDPDAEPALAAPSSMEVNDVEDTLQVPIRSIEDEDAEEAAQLAELNKRRNGAQEDEGDEDDGNLEELLRGLQGDEEEGEIEGEEDDEILAELPQEEEPEIEIVLGEESAVPETQTVALPEASANEPAEEDVQMESSMSPSCVSSCPLALPADRYSSLITSLRLA